MADGDLSSSRRRSQRLIKLKEASESEESRMLKLKREWRALLDLERDRIEADRKALAARLEALAEAAKARSAGGATPQPCDPFRSPSGPLPVSLSTALSGGSTTPPPACDPPRLLPVAPPPPAGPAGTKRKKVVKWKVPQEHIDHIILTQRDPYNDDFPLKRLGKRHQRFREVEAQRRVLDEKIFEYKQAIIKQFREKGYAEGYSETDDDAEQS